MSLINQMLKDLEQRRAESGGLPTPHREVRPLPALPRRGPGALVWALLLGVLLAAGGLWWHLRTPSPELLPKALLSAASDAALPALTVPAPVTTEVAGGPSVATQPAETRVAVPASEPRSARSNGGPVGELRLSDQLSLGRNEPAPTPAQSPAPSPSPQVAKEGPGAVPGGGAEPAGETVTSIEKRSLETNPREQAERLYRSALSQFAQGRDADGTTTLNAALRLDPGHLAARQLAIRRHLERQAPDAAQGELEAGLERHPEQSAWAMLLSRLKIDRGDLAGALAVLDRHKGYATSSADYQAAIAAVQQRMNAYADAEASFLRATQLDPANGRWWIGLGMVRESSGKTAMAREAYQNALRTGSLNADLKAFAEAKLK